MGPKMNLGGSGFKDTNRADTTKPTSKMKVQNVVQRPAAFPTASVREPNTPLPSSPLKMQGMKGE